MATFDYADFKTRWRALAAKHHFDPVEGATSYQIALIKAETAQHERRPIDWGRYESTAHGGSEGARDAVEAEAWRNLNAEANRRRHTDLVLVDVVTLRQIYPDAAREFVAETVGRSLAALRASPVQFGLGLELA